MTSGVIQAAEPQMRQGLPNSGGQGSCTRSPSTWTSSSFAANYGDPYNNAYLEIRRVLQRHGFSWQQGSVYFGGESVTAVTWSGRDRPGQPPAVVRGVGAGHPHAADRGTERPDAGGAAGGWRTTLRRTEDAMLPLHDHGPRLCDGLTRREWLRVGGLGAFGLSLPRCCRPAPSAAAPAPASASARRRRASCCSTSAGRRSTRPGTPSPTPRRDPRRVQADRHHVPGIHVGELMPRTARLTRQDLRPAGLSTDDNAHSSSGYWMLTGVPHQPTNSENAKPGAPNDWPCLAAVVQRLRPRPKAACPRRSRCPTTSGTPAASPGRARTAASSAAPPTPG